MPSSEKIKLTSSQLSDVLSQIETQVLPLNAPKVKLLKTLQKIVLANVEIVDDEKQLLLNERIALRSDLLMKLANIRRQIPKNVTNDIANNWSETFKKVKELVDHKPEAVSGISYMQNMNDYVVASRDIVSQKHNDMLAVHNQTNSQRELEDVTNKDTPPSDLGKNCGDEKQKNIENEHGRQATYDNNFITTTAEDKKLQEMTSNHFAKLRDMNENIPKIIENFRNAMNVIEDATQKKEATAEDVALTYFCEKQ